MNFSYLPVSSLSDFVVEKLLILEMNFVIDFRTENTIRSGNIMNSQMFIYAARISYFFE